MHEFQQISQKIAELEKQAVIVTTTFAIFKWLGSIVFIYILGIGIYVFIWLSRFKKHNRERADMFFEIAGKEREDAANRIETLESCNNEIIGLVNELFGKISHEKELREKDIKDCKERCAAILCNRV
jgi:hypothetical protein